MTETNNTIKEYRKQMCDKEAERIDRTMKRIFSNTKDSDICIHYHVCHQRVIAGCPSNGCPEFERR